MPTDPTSIRSQPSLTTSTGRIWLIVGGVFAAIAIAVLIPMTQLPPPGVALAGAIAVAALYLAMIVVRLAVSPGHRRLTLMAVGMLSIAGVSLVTAIIVAGAAASGR